MSIQDCLKVVGTAMPEVFRTTVSGGMTTFESALDEGWEGHCVTEKSGVLPCRTWLWGDEDLGGEVGVFGRDGVGDEESRED